MFCPQPFRKKLGVYGFLFVVGLMLVLWVASPWVSAQETPKPKPQEWQINGILAALDDDYPGVKRMAFEKLTEFDAKELAAFPNQSEEIEKRAIDLVQDNQTDSGLLIISAVAALGTLGKADVRVVPVLRSIVNDPKASSDLRTEAIEALGTLGKADASVVQFLKSIINNPREDSDLRVSAAVALGTLGKAGISMAFLKSVISNPQEDSFFRSSAVAALDTLGKADASVVASLKSIVNNPQEEFYLHSIPG